MEQEDWHGVERTEKGLYFSPENENVIFASALHGLFCAFDYTFFFILNDLKKILIFFLGYGFTLSDFARIWSKKICMPEKYILSKLFTDSFFSKGMIKEGAECLGKKTLFEQFIFQPLWDVHQSGLVDEDLEKLKVCFY